jgi:hypothetical protein
MRRITWIFILQLTTAAIAAAQDKPRADFNLNIGTFGVRPDGADPRAWRRVAETIPLGSKVKVRTVGGDEARARIRTAD